jgi:K+-transporting ATPase A subunit
MILQWPIGHEAVRHWLAEQPGHHGFSEMLYEFRLRANNGSDLKV